MRWAGRIHESEDNPSHKQGAEESRHLSNGEFSHQMKIDLHLLSPL